MTSGAVQNGQLDELCPPPLSTTRTSEPSAATLSGHEVTELLQDWSEGDESALDRLMPLVYDDLRRLAHQYMKQERAGHILQTSALIMKRTYGWLISRASTGENQAQFFGIAARVMRRIPVNEAGKRKSDKRGKDVIHVTLNEATNVGHEQAANVMALMTR